MPICLNASMKKLFALLWVVALCALLPISGRAQTISVTYNFAAYFGTNAQVSRLELEPLPPYPVDGSGNYRIQNRAVFTPANTPSMTNGSVTTNVLVNALIKATFSGPGGWQTRTNYFPASLTNQGGTINASTYDVAYFNVYSNLQLGIYFNGTNIAGSGGIVSNVAFATNAGTAQLATNLAPNLSATNLSMVGGGIFNATNFTFTNGPFQIIFTNFGYIIYSNGIQLTSFAQSTLFVQGQIAMTNLATGAGFSTETNAHLHVTDECGTQYDYGTNGVFKIVQTNGNSFIFTNGSATFTGILTGNGGNLTNVTASFVTGTLTNKTTGNAASATMATNVVSGISITNAVFTSSGNTSPNALTIQPNINTGYSVDSKLLGSGGDGFTVDPLGNAIAQSLILTNGETNFGPTVFGGPIAGTNGNLTNTGNFTATGNVNITGGGNLYVGAATYGTTFGGISGGTVTGTLQAGTFTGNGSGLTNINYTNLVGIPTASMLLAARGVTNGPAGPMSTNFAGIYNFGDSIAQGFSTGTNPVGVTYTPIGNGYLGLVSTNLGLSYSQKAEPGACISDIAWQMYNIPSIGYPYTNFTTNNGAIVLLQGGVNDCYLSNTNGYNPLVFSNIWLGMAMWNCFNYSGFAISAGTNLGQQCRLTAFDMYLGGSSYPYGTYSGFGGGHWGVEGTFNMFISTNATDFITFSNCYGSNVCAWSLQYSPAYATFTGGTNVVYVDGVSNSLISAHALTNLHVTFSSSTPAGYYMVGNIINTGSESWHTITFSNQTGCWGTNWTGTPFGVSAPIIAMPEMQTNWNAEFCLETTYQWGSQTPNWNAQVEQQQNLIKHQINAVLQNIGLPVFLVNNAGQLTAAFTDNDFIHPDNQGYTNAANQITQSILNNINWHKN